MSGRTRVGAAFQFALALGGCGFGTPGGGSVMSSPLGDAGDATSEGSDGETESPAADAGSGPGGDGTADGTGGMTGIGSITTPTSDDDGTGEAGSSGEPPDGTTTGVPPDPCANPPTQHLAIEVSAAAVAAPMVTSAHPTHGDYAYSTQDGQGTVSFPFATDCEDTWRAWAFIYDEDPGFSTQGDPDSFNVWVDEGGTTLWVYGCQTGGIFPPQWSWQSVNDTGLCLFENDEIEFTLPAGPHAMHFRNVEPGSGNGGSDPGSVAAIARIVITNDPAFSP